MLQGSPPAVVVAVVAAAAASGGIAVAVAEMDGARP